MSEPEFNEALVSSYQLIETLLRNPEELDIDTVTKSSDTTIEMMAKYLDERAAALQESFIKDLASINGDEYVQTFELSPKCPLYMGYHMYEEPKTCSTIASSKRNMYMIELINIYKHFGLVREVNELPDFLPIMIEFLWISLQQRNDEIRVKFIKEYLLPSLPDVTNQLEELKSPYLKLLNAFARIVEVDLRLSDGKGVREHVG